MPLYNIFLFFSFFNRYFRKLKLISASAVSTTMVSQYNSHTCPIQSWNMHVMSRSNYTIVSDVSYNFNCILHRVGYYSAKLHLYQVIFFFFHYFYFLMWENMSFWCSTFTLLIWCGGVGNLLKKLIRKFFINSFFKVRR